MEVQQAHRSRRLAQTIACGRAVVAWGMAGLLLLPLTLRADPEEEVAPRVVFVLPACLQKYVPRMPHYFPLFRADEHGKHCAATSVCASVTDAARDHEKAQFFIALGPPSLKATNELVRRSPRTVSVSFSYVLHFRAPGKPPAVLLRGTFSYLDEVSPAHDLLDQMVRRIHTDLATELGRSLGQRLVHGKQLTPPPLSARQQSRPTPSGILAPCPCNRVAFHAQRLECDEDKHVTFTFTLANQLPAAAVIEGVELVNVITGETLFGRPEAKEGIHLTTRESKLAAIKVPRDGCPPEIQAVRIKDLYLVIPD